MPQPVEEDNNFSIQIDATQLYYVFFLIPGITQFIETKTPQTVKLAPGPYSFQVASGDIGFAFQVTAQGKLDYSSQFDTFLEGRGTSQLTVKGLEVTIDARYLFGAGIIVDVNAQGLPFFQYGKLRLLPSKAIAVQQGSSLVSSFTYALNTNGTFSYNPTYDLDNGGFLGGQGTSTLVFYGYPVVIDIRAANKPLLLIADIPSNSVNSVLIASLLPVHPSRLHLITDSSIVTSASFGVDVNGQLKVDPASAASFVISKFKGIPLLKATPALK